MTITGSEWLVVLGGLGAIAWVNWYFFVAGRVPAAASFTSSADGAVSDSAGPQELTITVDGGYSPSVVRVKTGRTVRLVFDRKDSGSCSEEIVLPDFGIRRFLPTGQKTAVEITPTRAGRFDFMCGMSMLRGAIVAEE